MAVNVIYILTELNPGLAAVELPSHEETMNKHGVVCSSSQDPQLKIEKNKRMVEKFEMQNEFSMYNQFASCDNVTPDI